MKKLGGLLVALLLLVGCASAMLLEKQVELKAKYFTTVYWGEDCIHEKGEYFTVWQRPWKTYEEYRTEDMKYVDNIESGSGDTHIDWVWTMPGGTGFGVGYHFSGEIDGKKHEERFCGVIGFANAEDTEEFLDGKSNGEKIISSFRMSCVDMVADRDRQIEESKDRVIGEVPDGWCVEE